MRTDKGVLLMYLPTFLADQRCCLCDTIQADANETFKIKSHEKKLNEKTVPAAALQERAESRFMCKTG